MNHYNVSFNNNVNTVYIMSPVLFAHLSNINEFNNLNCETYPEHITLFLSDYLTHSQKIYILDASSDDEALNLLRSFGVNFTHDM
jgi:hypothetical protein